MDTESLTRVRIPAWFAAAAVVAAGIVGYVIGRPGEPDQTPRSGTVTIVDTGEGTVCVGDQDGSDNECYRAPGVSVQPGDRIRYLLGTAPLDAEKPDAGTQQVLIYLDAE